MSGSACVGLILNCYSLESATELLNSKLSRLQDGVDKLQELAQLQHANCQAATEQPYEAYVDSASATAQVDAEHITESSSEFLQIPAQRTTADAVLRWEIFEDRYPPSALVGTQCSGGGAQNQDSSNDIETFTARSGVLAPNEEQIPSLIESFLRNVHTKNPVLDAEQLIRQARIIASDGLGWDAWSCLVLLAAALGRIAKPFDAALAVPASPGANYTSDPVWSTEPANTAEELEEAESYFVLGCRRLGGLKHSLLGSQCFFVAGVYLMYTLRPLLSWQYFIHASTLFRLYMHTAYELRRLVPPSPSHRVSTQDRTTKRLEECMYWSCFKSEIEFRVELPLPQSELASYHHPQMFPSPRSPAPADEQDTPLGRTADEAADGPTPSLLREPSASSAHSRDYVNPRERVARLCNEEESWYYYLTEIALRRIGNRIINTFFRKGSAAWLDVRPLLGIALEFDTQISAWSANLPAAMKQWETDSAIKRPEPAVLLEQGGNHVLQELSWALENRLLEVRSWLYQPFMYWLIHHRTTFAGTSSAGPKEGVHSSESRDDFVLGVGKDGLDGKDAATLYHFLVSGIQCNLKILDMRSLRHRHHGLWYDMRSTMTAALILLAIIKSGNEAWIPGGAGVIFGSCARAMPDGRPVAGKLGHVIAAYDFWAKESPDLKRHREVLREVADSVRGTGRFDSVQ
ncbi:hypothetical protein LTR91_008281 [Friedmanniomyces endolithicus]|uniref:Transcription factor domain-containing protein n=1 Tax=Friedmanniomyces endolithicus TaxID=329885 RepID=A0AAN6KN52_9PEZI|nr:hypothetical protein LTR35_001202 [Friedmanniomyces endolithicus]KAK0296551.1 hypothetical protein LTS00_004876 [Friedmanniomyces endolithicus]KAK0304571.1 hypothetical protein LTR01_007364 [Friedmanniomyces endolithicus]KAK0826715.1 hypothetical protein LTR73_006049 [Friedmanniomyces endolithicus]KAK0932178.1 hypothetical protein LTR57_000398 [Friedmanniomyces endolithicus]